MKKNLLFYCFIIFITPMTYAQVNLLTEDFETDGEGTRYTTNTFFTSCNDLFERSTNGGVYCMTNEPTNVSGTFYWSGEDCDVATGGTGVLTLDPLTVTGYNLELKVLLAVERPNDGRFETNDELLFQYNMDGGGWNTFGAFYGSFEGSGQTKGDLTEDADFNGMGDPGGLEIESSDFVDFTFSIPVTGNSLQVRFIMGQDQGTEGVMLDNIRIEGNTVLPVELTAFSVRQLEEDKVIINWQTATEENNEYFSIQRSKDGVSWKEINKIKGAGNSFETINYSMIDKNPFFGVSYYRLQQVDFNGDFEYSDVQSIHLKTTNSQYDIFPNPSSTSQINVKIPYPNTTVFIVDKNGKIIQRRIMPKGVHEIPLNGLSPGIYFIKFVHANQSETQKLVVTNP